MAMDNMHKKFGEVWLHGISSYMSRQTNKTDTHTHYNTSQPTQGQSNYFSHPVFITCVILC